MATATSYRTLNTEQRRGKESLLTHCTLTALLIQPSCQRSQLLLSYLLPRGDKPLDLALFLAAFEEAGLLTGRFRQACTRAVWQSGVCLDTGVGARTQDGPLLQTIATLA